MLVYLMGGPPQTSARASTLREKLQIKLSMPLSQYTDTGPTSSSADPLTPSTSYGHQAPARVATGVYFCLFVCLFCFVLFCFALLCFALLFVLFCFVLFCFVLFLFFVLFCFVLFCFVLFCFVLFCFVLFCFVLFCCLLVLRVMTTPGYIPKARARIEPRVCRSRSGHLNHWANEAVSAQEREVGGSLLDFSSRGLVTDLVLHRLLSP